MTDKKTYDVHRSMHGEGKDYLRGDTRNMTEAEAAPLVATGALALKGEKPMRRGDAVMHTYGLADDTAPVDYTTPTIDGVVQGQPAALQGVVADTALARAKSATRPRNP